MNTEIKNETKLENCSFIKTVLLFLVVLYHSCVFWTGNWWDTEPVFPSIGLNYLSLWLNSFHVYAFTLASGYIFAYKISKREYLNYLPFLRNKARRLIVPYYFTMIIWVAPISAYLFKWNIIYLIKKFILCINPSQLWFLWMLFGVFAFVWPVRYYILEKPMLGWGLSLLFYAVGMVGRKLVPNFFCIW